LPLKENSMLYRSNLEKMYLVYIHPLFEYACEFWDNCGIGYSDKLEKLQLDAARIELVIESTERNY
jgi:hypothetical protein